MLDEVSRRYTNSSAKLLYNIQDEKTEIRITIQIKFYKIEPNILVS